MSAKLPRVFVPRDDPTRDRAVTKPRSDLRGVSTRAVVLTTLPAMTSEIAQRAPPLRAPMPMATGLFRVTVLIEASAGAGADAVVDGVAVAAEAKAAIARYPGKMAVRVSSRKAVSPLAEMKSPVAAPPAVLLAPPAASLVLAAALTRVAVSPRRPWRQ